MVNVSIRFFAGIVITASLAGPANAAPLLTGDVNNDFKASEGAICARVAYPLNASTNVKPNFLRDPGSRSVADLSAPYVPTGFAPTGLCIHYDPSNGGTFSSGLDLTNCTLDRSGHSNGACSGALDQDGDGDPISFTNSAFIDASSEVDENARTGWDAETYRLTLSTLSPTGQLSSERSPAGFLITNLYDANLDPARPGRVVVGPEGLLTLYEQGRVRKEDGTNIFLRDQSAFKVQYKKANGSAGDLETSLNGVNQAGTLLTGGCLVADIFSDAEEGILGEFNARTKPFRVTSTGIEYLSADTNNDGRVDDFDLGAVIFDFGTQCDGLGTYGPACPHNADINYDGRVDDADLAEVIEQFGKTCHPSGSSQIVSGGNEGSGEVSKKSSSSKRSSARKKKHSKRHPHKNPKERRLDLKKRGARAA